MYFCFLCMWKIVEVRFPCVQYVTSLFTSEKSSSNPCEFSPQQFCAMPRMKQCSLRHPKCQPPTRMRHPPFTLPDTPTRSALNTTVGVTATAARQCQWPVRGSCLLRPTLSVRILVLAAAQSENGSGGVSRGYESWRSV